jgi:hypothetical protein
VKTSQIHEKHAGQPVVGDFTTTSMSGPLGVAISIERSGYGTTRGGGERWPHAPLAVPHTERISALRRRARGHEVASRQGNRGPWVVRCLLVDQVGGEPLEEEFVSPLAGELQIFGGVAVLAKAVLDEYSL